MASAWACSLGHLHSGWDLSGVGVGMWGAYCLLGWLVLPAGWSHIPPVSLGWFKSVTGVGHSLAMWPHPWHLKHWREFVIPLIGCITLSLYWAPGHSCLLPPFPVFPIPHGQVGKLQAGVVCPGPPLSLWELGWLGVLPLLPPLLWPLSQGLPRHTRGAVSLPSLGQGELGNLLPQFCHPFHWASHYCMALALTCIPDFLILTFHLGGGNHQLWVGGSGSAIQVLDRVAIGA